MKKISKNNKYTILALDHRGSFRKMLGTSNKKKITQTKKEILETIGQKASAIILDPIYGKKLAKQTKKPILFCLEKSGYRHIKKMRKTQLQPNWNAGKAKKLGASAIKLNLQHNPKANRRIINHNKKIVEKAGKQCKKLKLPFLLEIITYPISKKFNKEEAIIQSIKEFKKPKYNVKIFKLQYPGSIKACKKITQTLGKKPWVLLSAGKTMKTFAKELKTAIKAGCKGFTAGRAIWQKGIKARNKKEWFEKKGVKNINKLIKIVKK